MEAENRKIHLQKTKEFCLLDDTFAHMVFNNNLPAAQCLVRIILDRNDITVTRVTTQSEHKSSIGGHDLYFDCEIVDQDGNHADIEIQRSRAGAIPRRARYHSAMLDSTMLGKSQNFDLLKDSYTIFITETDVLCGRRAIYHVERQIVELNQLFQDGGHIIYINAAYRDTTTALGKLIHDFHCRTASEMYFNELAQRVHYFKDTRGGNEQMCDIMESIAKEREEKGRAEGSTETRIKTILYAYGKGHSAEQISDFNGYDLKDVREVIKNFITTKN